MACELVQRTFTNSQGEEVLVNVRQLSASSALSLHVELVSKLGNAIYPFIENKYHFGDIIYLMGRVESAEFCELFKRVLSSQATKDGAEIRPALFDMQFNGELMLACKIFAFVLEANFLDFFKEGLAINEQRRLEAEEASKLAQQKNSSPETI